jgi:condensin complex subunit 3
VTMLNNLVIPAVRSHEAPIRERGLHCLGLCCLLDKTLAEENITIFLHCFTKGHPALQVTALQILSDVLTTHPSLLTAAPATEATPDEPSPVSAIQKSLFKAFGKALKATHTPEVQSAAVTALCKLMLTLVITDEDLLRQLVITYFEPSTRDNAAARQALSYFLPVYCHSRRENMERMANVVIGVVHATIGMGEELEEEEEMVGMSAIAGMLVDWTDARKLVVRDGESAGWDEMGKQIAKPVNGDIHLDLAASVLEKVFERGTPSKWLKARTKIPHTNVFCRRRKESPPLYARKTVYHSSLHS